MSRRALLSLHDFKNYSMKMRNLGRAEWLIRVFIREATLRRTASRSLARAI